MSVSVVIIGSRDQRLEDTLRASGRIGSITWSADLGGLLDAHATQPDVVLVDVRRAPQVPPAVTSLKRQHPSTNVMLLASALDPALMLRGDARGRQRNHRRSTQPAGVRRGHRTPARAAHPCAGGPVFAFVGAKGGVGTTTTAVNVAMLLAKMSPSKALLIDLHLAYGDAAVFLGVDARFSVLDALENMHRLDCRVPEEPGGARRRPVSTCSRLRSAQHRG